MEIQNVIENCQGHFRALNTHLANHGYLAGPHLAAEIPMGTTLYRYFSIGLPVEKPPNAMA